MLFLVGLRDFETKRVGSPRSERRMSKGDNDNDAGEVAPDKEDLEQVFSNQQRVSAW